MLDFPESFDDAYKEAKNADVETHETIVQELIQALEKAGVKKGESGGASASAKP